MEITRNLIELISIAIIIIFLKKKTNINHNDLLTFILINIFIFVVYDYLSLNKSCQKNEQFSNSEPCNIKDIEKMFNNFISKKESPIKENFGSKIEHTKEDLLADEISKQISKVDHIIDEEGKQIDEEDLQVIEEEVVDLKEDVEKILKEDDIDDIKNIIDIYEKEKDKHIKCPDSISSSWNIVNEYDSSAASFPSIFTDGPFLSHANYDKESPTCNNNIGNELPHDHSDNSIHKLKNLSSSETKAKYNDWSCK